MMRKINIQLFLLLLFLKAIPAFTAGFTCIQEPVDEKIILFIDRSVYITGENIHFNAVLLPNSGNATSALSQVVYCELFSAGGSRLAGQKYMLSESSANGCISIPEHLLTGTYFLRAYTRLMRNTGPASYAYCQIKIINPAKKEVLPVVSNRDKPVEDLVNPVPGQVQIKSAISVAATVYKTRDTVSFTIDWKGEPAKSISSACISVVPKGSGIVTVVQPPHIVEPMNVGSGYVPENRGLSLVGRLTETASDLPLIDKKVNLSIIGEGRDFMSVRTDTSGRFYFSLPWYYGTRDLFLCAEKTASKNAKIWVDNDFCTVPFQLQAPEFNLTPEERQMIQNMAVNEQINSHFQQNTHSDSLSTTLEKNAFYGKPTNVIVLDKYIQLPTLEEYFNELPSQVRVRKSKGEPYFIVQGSSDISFNDPLVLIDWVAVDEPSRILAIPPQNISRIEIVNQLYVKGGQTYGGIISLISKKGDFGGINLPSTGIFLNYNFLARQTCNNDSYFAIADQPDARNTLFWKTEMNPGSGKTETFSFSAPDTPGKYMVCMEGLTADGKRFFDSVLFEVKK